MRHTWQGSARSSPDCSPATPFHAGTTWWGIKSKIATGMTPNKSDGPAGSCTFGPVINLVGSACLCQRHGAALPASQLRAPSDLRCLRSHATPSATPPAPQVGLNLNPHIPLCKTWLYERGVATPFNLYEAQKARRLRLQADGTW